MKITPSNLPDRRNHEQHGESPDLFADYIKAAPKHEEDQETARESKPEAGNEQSAINPFTLRHWNLRA
jgi:hypothetical protein